MNKIVLSVIVPIYNVEPWLEECLERLERQTLQNFEVILVNDGSTDGSKQIAEKFVDRNDNFILINRKNGGLSVARNTGLEKASGEYVYFLDSDDYLLDTALEVLYKKAKSENLDVLKFAAYTFSEPSRELTWSSVGGYKYKGSYPGVYRGIDLLQMFIDNDDTYYPSCCLIFTKRSVIEKNGLRFYQGIVHEDNLFHFQLMALSERTAILNEPFYCRRYRQGSITKTYDWLNKTRSMCISAGEADAFVTKHPEIMGKTSSWYVVFFINMMREYWEQMDSMMRSSAETRSYFEQVRPIAKKYKYGGNLYTRIFFIRPTAYMVLKLSVTVVKKILGK